MITTRSTLRPLSNPGKGRQASKVRAILALLVRESDNLTLEDLAKTVERDASTLSKQANSLAANSLKIDELQHEISEVRAYLFQMPECQA